MNSPDGSTTQGTSPSEPTSSSLPPPRATALAISRKTHRKSRNGCYNCKRRKIKCDEAHPSCRNCVKHAVECDFISRRSASVHDGNPSADSSLHLLDLELLHNFTSSTFATLSNDPTLRKVWKTAVMRRAVGCDFVMRTILAVSGVHIAQYRPQQRHKYVSCALTHHQIASQTAIDLLSDPRTEQKEDLWLFSVLTIYYALGSPKEQASASLIIGESILPDWILLLNGVRHLLSSMHATSYSGTLSPIVNQGQECWNKAHQPEHENSNILDELSENVRRSVTDAEELAIHNEAIRELRCQLSLVLSTERQSLDIIDAFLWQFTMSESFMPLVQQANQAAVAIFAHSLIIHNALSYHKWLHGWDTVLISRAWDMLDDEHRDWIRWPIEEIGWVLPPLIRAEKF